MITEIYGVLKFSNGAEFNLMGDSVIINNSKKHPITNLRLLMREYATDAALISISGDEFPEESGVIFTDDKEHETHLTTPENTARFIHDNMALYPGSTQKLLSKGEQMKVDIKNEKQAFEEARKVKVYVYRNNRPTRLYLVDSLIAVQEDWPERSIQENYKEALDEFSAAVALTIQETQK